MLAIPAMNCDVSEPARAEPPTQPESIFGSEVPLLAILGFLLLAIGLLSSWGIKHIDQDYSKLIAQTALDLDRLHDVSYHSGIGFATEIEMASTGDSEKRAALLRAISDERTANNAVFAELLSKTTDVRLRSSLDDVLAKRAIYANRTDVFLQNISRQAGAAQGNLTYAPVLEAFVSYQKSCDKLADLVRETSLRESGRLTSDSAKFRLVFFAAGALPIILGLLAVALTFYFVWVTPPEADLKE